MKVIALYNVPLLIDLFKFIFFCNYKSFGNLIEIDFDANFFWKWTDFQSYLDFMLLFAALVGILTYLLVDVPLFVETVGLLAVLTEAMLGIPQFLRNFTNKSTNGMRYDIINLLEKYGRLNSYTY